jgi:ribulose-5-phosphate 4-epimerase/fuculose-1-phosphate aldolase
MQNVEPPGSLAHADPHAWWVPGMTLTPSATSSGVSIPALMAEQRFALLARILYRLGFRDALAGHLTIRRADGHLLANPFPVGWDELCASDVCVISRDGEHLRGRERVSQAVELHVALHRERPDLEIIVHNHPEWSTVWACAGRIPPIYDQTSANMDTDIACVPYTGPVLDPAFAAALAQRLGRAEVALLENHGVLVVGDSIDRVLWRAYVLERRCVMAWRVEAIGGGVAMPPKYVDINKDVLVSGFGGVFPGFFDYLARREIRLDPGVLD